MGKKVTNIYIDPDGCVLCPFLWGLRGLRSDSVGQKMVLIPDCTPRCPLHREVTCRIGMRGRASLGTGDPRRIGPEIESFSCSGRWLREKHHLQGSLLSGSWLCPTQLRRAACALEGLCQEYGCPVGTRFECSLCFWPPGCPPGHCAYLPQVPKPLPAMTLPGILAAH